MRRGAGRNVMPPLLAVLFLATGPAVADVTPGETLLPRRAASAADPLARGAVPPARRRPLVGVGIAGVSTLATSWAASMFLVFVPTLCGGFGECSGYNGWMALPVVGPWVALAVDGGDWSSPWRTREPAVVISLAAVNATALAATIVGFAYRRTDSAPVVVVPLLQPGLGGLAFAGAF